MSGRAARVVSVVQGATYLVTGVWPLLHRRSFEAVTGPKVDGWLVTTVSGLLIVIGAAEMAAARRDTVTRELAFVAAGTAATLGAVSAVGAARGRLRRVYLVDAVLEGGLVAAWALALARGDATD